MINETQRIKLPGAVLPRSEEKEAGTLGAVPVCGAVLIFKSGVCQQPLPFINPIKREEP